MFAGNDMKKSSAFSLDLKLWKYDNPDAPKKADVNIKVENLIVEQCSDVIVSLTQIVPDF